MENVQQLRVDLKVKGQDGKELFFRVRENASLEKLMNSYCQQKKLDRDIVRFLYKGKRITKKQTPARLQMKNGDQIEAMLHMNGGGSCNTS